MDDSPRDLKIAGLPTSTGIPAKRGVKNETDRGYLDTSTFAGRFRYDPGQRRQTEGRLFRLP